MAVFISVNRLVGNNSYATRANGGGDGEVCGREKKKVGYCGIGVGGYNVQVRNQSSSATTALQAAGRRKEGQEKREGPALDVEGGMEKGNKKKDMNTG